MGSEFSSHGHVWHFGDAAGLDDASYTPTFQRADWIANFAALRQSHCNKVCIIVRNFSICVYNVINASDFYYIIKFEGLDLYLMLDYRSR